MSSLESLGLSFKVCSITLLQEHLPKITRVLPLPAFWMTTSLFFTKWFRILNLEGVRYSGGSRSLYKSFGMRSEQCLAVYPLLKTYPHSINPLVLYLEIVT